MITVDLGVNSQIYRRYYAMLNRCFNQNAEKFSYYGGRCITVCDEWLGKDGYRNFVEWSLQNGYINEKYKNKNAVSLDRIDVDGNYSPSNCRWVNYTIQAINRRTTRFYTLDGETLPVKYMAQRLGVSRSRLWKLLKLMSFDEVIKIIKGEKI